MTKYNVLKSGKKSYCSYPTGKCRDCFNAYHNEHNTGRRDAINKQRRERVHKDTEFKERLSKLRKESYKRRIMTTLVRNAKKRAAEKGLDFSLTLESLKIPKYCPLLNIPLLDEANLPINSPSIDRVRLDFGYTPDNCRIISMKANTMKNNATPGELLDFSQNIIKYLRCDIVETE